MTIKLTEIEITVSYRIGLTSVDRERNLDELIKAIVEPNHTLISYEILDGTENDGVHRLSARQQQILGLAAFTYHATGNIYPGDPSNTASDEDPFTLSAEETTLIANHQDAIEQMANDLIAFRHVGIMVQALQEKINKFRGQHAH